jgi:hypothetical protein
VKPGFIGFFVGFFVGSKGNVGVYGLFVVRWWMSMGSMGSKSPWLVWWLDGCRMVFVAKKMDDLLMLGILSVWFLWV